MSLILPAALPSLTVGGRVFTDLTNLITLISDAAGAAYGTFRRPGGNAGYAVTAGKTLTIYAVRALAQNPSQASGAYFLMAQADNDSGISTATAWTNPVYPAGISGFGALGLLSAYSSVLEGTVNVPVAAGKYLTMKTSGTSTEFTVFAFGYEA